MRHLYIHVPFCARRCSYCDFAIAVRKRVPAARYVETIRREHALRREREPGWDTPLDTLYLGGGTPSLLPPGDLADLVTTFALNSDAEVTLEANPDDVTLDAAAAWSSCGVTRVSLGVQSFHAAVLEWMHRTHDVAAAERAVETLRAAGIGEVSLDLIFALPAGMEHDFRRDLERAIRLAPDHLAVYGLSVEPRTPLARWVARGRTVLGDDEQFAHEFLLAHEILTEAGFDHYEVSNYARRLPQGGSRRARHNWAYWNDAAYAGLGPSAHGFAEGIRRWNVREWVAYERVVARGNDPIEGKERLTPAQRALERVYLGLRTVAGIPAADLANPSSSRSFLAATDAGWLTTRAGRVYATPSGWLMLDALAAALTTSPEGG